MAPTPGKSVDVPEVTVVVTSRNRSELLQIALRSIQMQNLAALKFIVVDEDSSDDAVAVAQSFAAVDAPFYILWHDRRWDSRRRATPGLVGARGR
jgi:glycosyltransferase involved in cell wall biosynthesis